MLNQNLGVGATYESSHWMLGCQFQQDNVTPHSAHIPINGVVVKKKILCTKLTCLKSRVQIVGKKIRRDPTQLQRRSKLNYFQRCCWHQIQNEHIYFNRFVPSSVRISFEITFFPQSVWKHLIFLPLFVRLLHVFIKPGENFIAFTGICDIIGSSVAF